MKKANSLPWKRQFSYLGFGGLHKPFPLGTPKGVKNDPRWVASATYRRSLFDPSQDPYLYGTG